MRQLSIKQKNMIRNKDLPNEEQIRIVLRNYDKKQFECDALKKENAELKKRLEVKEKHFKEELEKKDILYKNMLKHFNDKKNIDGEDWEHQYKVLKTQYAQRGEKVINQANKITKLTSELQKTKNILDSVRGTICRTYNKIEDFCSDPIAGHEEITAKKEEAITIYGINTEVSTQERKFICYVRELIESFKKTGSLRGVAMIGREYGVSTLTKEQFFRFGLHEDKEFTDEYILGLYEKAKKHL